MLWKERKRLHWDPKTTMDKLFLQQICFKGREKETW